MFRFCIAAALAVPFLAACSAQQFESPPVTVRSPQGPVICQLYTQELLYWDRVTAHPAGISVDAANALCRAEGRARQKG